MSIFLLEFLEDRGTVQIKSHKNVPKEITYISTYTHANIDPYKLSRKICKQLLTVAALGEEA